MRKKRRQIRRLFFHVAPIYRNKRIFRRKGLTSPAPAFPRLGLTWLARLNGLAGLMRLGGVRITRG
jgi:hypothetical protein